MTNQIKYLLAPLALSVLVGCGKPEANSEEKTLEEQCEAYYSGQMAKNMESAVRGAAFLKKMQTAFINWQRSVWNGSAKISKGGVRLALSSARRFSLRGRK